MTRVRKKKRSNKDKVVYISTDVFRDRSISVLESVVKHLKENNNLTYKEISEILNRNERTVWTAYNRVKKKSNEKEN